MAVKRKKTKELSYKQASHRLDFTFKGIKSSADVEPCKEIIGQEKAMAAIRTGLKVKGRGYNIFISGTSGTGRNTAIKHFLEQELKNVKPRLRDFCYVNNFKNEDKPRLLIFNPGDGRRFKRDMGYLISSIRKAVPKIFMSEDYKDRHSRVSREFEGRQKDLIGNFEDRLTADGFVMVQLQSGMTTRNEIQPLVDGEPNSLDKLEKLAGEGKFSESKLDEFRRRWDSLRREFDVVSVESKKLSNKLDDALEKLDYSMIAPLITDKASLLRRRYQIDKVVSYLDEVEEALLSDLDRFREAQPRRGEQEAPPYRKREPFEEFSVNLILDHAETKAVPLVVEKSPSYKNLFGSLERVVDRFGYWRTDFTRIFTGSIIKATGGFLLVNAMDLLTEPGVWLNLKRSIRNSEVEIAAYDPFYMMAGAGIKPEPIPLDVKVVLIGQSDTYNLLWQWDEDFKRIFKIKAEFDSVIKFNKKNVKQYFRFIKLVTEQIKLPEFDLSGMQAIAEYGQRLSGQRNKLTSRFSSIADLIKESALCAEQNKSKQVNRRDVECAVEQKKSRANLIEEKVQEMYDNETLLVSTSGSATGQINGLAVYKVGEYSFGRPTRITASVSLGRAGIINVEREADLSGPIHTKGVLVLTGYLRNLFAQDKPMAMSASITFEQSYSGVDGDSASAAEIFVLISALTQIPIKQGIAVTGSVNQHGQIQPIGGVNEKIEGFYDVCKSRRLTGSQGVIIPHQNVQELLLRSDVLEAIRKGKFHIYPIKKIEEGIEILTGKTAGKRNRNNKFTPGSVFAKADDKLRQMALLLDRFGKDAKPDNDSNKKHISKKKL
ncbi:MAG: AAA family ATPase [candidate division Zixibacteria bacterium]|nr:AAA family ATPase [candidate division Zixibacteria bacterium]